MRKLSRFTILFLLLWVNACSELPAKTGGTDVGYPDDLAYLNILRRVEGFEHLAEKNSVKYLVNLEGTNHPRPLVEDCYFISTEIYPWHYQFLASFEEYSNVDLATYSRWVLYRSQRRFYGGDFQYWKSAIHPKTSEKGVYSFLVYGARGHLNVDEIETVYKRMQACAPFARDKIVFIPWEGHQKLWLINFAKDMDEKNIPYLFPKDLVGNDPIIYSAGEGYGTLRVVPKGERLEDYGPLDIVITESAPNDISVVQGLIAQDPQNELSHTNLRLREKKVPNVSLLNIYNYPDLDQLKDKLVHVIANDSEFVIESANLDDAKKFWDSRRKTLPDVKSDLSVKVLGTFKTMKNKDALSYGAKAANLGELYSILPKENRNLGFAIPFSAYEAFVQSENLQSEIDTMLDDERTNTDNSFKKTALKALRKKFKKGKISPELLKEIETKIVEVFGEEGRFQRIRFRSSTNVEDLDEITGAGLYSSKSGCIADDLDDDESGPSLCLSEEEKIEKTRLLKAAKKEFKAHPDRVYLEDLIDDLDGDLKKEKPVAKAIKKVWASLWNERAFDERNYYRIDHKKAFMGIAVNRSFVLEKANAVALTQLKVDEGLALYRLNSQTGEESVVQPDNPKAIAEVLTFRRSKKGQLEDVEILVRSTLVGENEQIWTAEQLDEIAQLLFLAHDHFSTKVYPHLKPFSLDVEIKLTSDNRIVFKQARPFVSPF